MGTPDVLSIYDMGQYAGRIFVVLINGKRKE